MLFSKNELDNITEERLKGLIENKVSESKTLDYKEEYHLNDYDEIKEFLSDVSAFANAEGGNLIFGIKEEEGLPVELTGVKVLDTDAEKLKMENLLRDCIEPRIPGCEIKFIPLSNDAHAIIIFIPKSFNSPHVVKYKKHWRFYSRNSAGKYQLDVQELKAAFIAHENIAEKIRNFRAERISRILNGETPIAMNEEPKFVLHLIPLASFTQNPQLDFSNKFMNGVKSNELMRSLWYKYNFEGFLFHDAYNNIGTSYIQFYRNGIIEIVNSEYTVNAQKLITWGTYESEYYRYLEYLISVLDYSEISAPYFIMNSVLNIKGYKFFIPEKPNLRLLSNDRIQQNVLIIPELFLTNKEDLTHEFLKPLFDPVWNACGFPHSMNYDENGKWKEDNRLE